MPPIERDDIFLADAERVYDIIYQRRDFSIGIRPIRSSELCRKLNISLTRGQYIREIIHYLRSHANPICANSNGYFWAKTPDELQESIDSLKGRARSILQARQGLLLAYKKHFNLNMELM